ncbi:hypothetical protein [Rhizobium ruizarguesonis]|uniref:hypothetical protein n=1 Tax=Rhizobium ruizarguesonis TaxID=2081791 RepID=UPI0013EEEA32|nr:hypothetical protein [Rhizobium ruizarguesonis]
MALRKKFDSHLVVFDSHDPQGMFKEAVVIDARVMANVGAIRYSVDVSDLPDMMTFGTWIDISRPVADVINSAIEWRRLLKAYSPWRTHDLLLFQRAGAQGSFRNARRLSR